MKIIPCIPSEYNGKKARTPQKKKQQKLWKHIENE
jgi:hypothetical protein